MFPVLQHINRPNSTQTTKEISLTTSIHSHNKEDSPVDVVPVTLSLFHREPGAMTLGQYSGSHDRSSSSSSSDHEFNANLEDTGSNHHLYSGRRSVLHQGECLNSSLDFRGLWVTYMTSKYSGVAMNSTQFHKTIDISDEGDGSLKPEDKLTLRSLNASANNYLKEMNVATIKKLQAMKNAQLNAIHGGLSAPTLSMPLSLSSNVPSAVKGSLSAAQVTHTPTCELFVCFVEENSACVTTIM